MPSVYKRDSKGLGEVLKSAEVAAAIHLLAETTARNAANLHPDAEEVVVDDYTTDRAASSVTVRDVRAKGWQVKDGFLTKAAAAAGLEVTAKPV